MLASIQLGPVYDALSLRRIPILSASLLALVWLVGYVDADESGVIGRNARRGAGICVWQWHDVAVCLLAQCGPVERHYGARRVNRVYGVFGRGPHNDCCGVHLQRLLGNSDIRGPERSHSAECHLYSRALLWNDLYLSIVRLFKRITRDGTKYDRQRTLSSRRPSTGAGFVSGLSWLRHGCWGGMDSDAPLIRCPSRLTRGL